MKKILFFSVVIVVLNGCVNQRQKTNIVGRTDDVYFTASDTRKKAFVSYAPQQNTSQSNNNQSKAGNYTNSYSNRLCYFGSRNRFSYNNYQPVLIPSMMFHNQSGWTFGISYGYSMSGYGRNHYSSFSPYYGCSMPYNNPFYSYGWGGSWMTSYYPFYSYNPYMYNYGSYGYGYYGNYGNYNPYNANRNTNNGNYNYGRRNASPYPSNQTNTNNNNTNNNWWNTNTNSGGTGSSNSSSGKWWNSSSSSSSGSGNSGSSSSGAGRSSTGNTGGSTRRR
ncbi:MAG: hypothetical protein PSX81_15730 [bacterium]|nr:hypothetical protein [bacterium]